jgi:serine/threonine protein kinase
MEKLATSADQSSSLTTADARRLLRYVYPLEADFVAFCIDYFASVARKFSSGQSRVEKENILLQSVEPDEIIIRLNKADSNEKSKTITSSTVLSRRYKLINQIGQGGFATVWRATDLYSSTEVAIKIFRKMQSIKRFRIGAMEMSKLNHPNIVKVLELPIQYKKWYYYVMEYMPKGDLHANIIAHRVDTNQGLIALIEIGKALSYAHSRNLVHRDIKPQNILLDVNNSAHLSDFDLVRTIDKSFDTCIGIMMGTGFYAAPEQMYSHVTYRSDIYSLAITCMFVLHGRDFPRNDELWEPIDFLETKIIASVAQKSVLARALARDPRQRYESVNDFCELLANTLRPAQTVYELTDSHKPPSTEQSTDVSNFPQFSSSGYKPLTIEHACLAPELQSPLNAPVHLGQRPHLKPEQPLAAINPVSHPLSPPPVVAKLLPTTAVQPEAIEPSEPKQPPMLEPSVVATKPPASSLSLLPELYNPAPPAQPSEQTQPAKPEQPPAGTKPSRGSLPPPFLPKLPPVPLCPSDTSSLTDSVQSPTIEQSTSKYLTDPSAGTTDKHVFNFDPQVLLRDEDIIVPDRIGAQVESVNPIFSKRRITIGTIIMLLLLVTAFMTEKLFQTLSPHQATEKALTPVMNPIVDLGHLQSSADLTTGQTDSGSKPRKKSRTPDRSYTPRSPEIASPSANPPTQEDIFAARLDDEFGLDLTQKFPEYDDNNLPRTIPESVLKAVQPVLNKRTSMCKESIEKVDYKLTIIIYPSGRIDDKIEVEPDNHGQIEECLRNILRQIRFPRFRDEHHRKYQYRAIF